ncbi:hypothetical protein A2635_01685 [Candidatus Peribacteria bacterium RIFCSPHIGHO2_01_FULL_51_9]|nr:MAG: hypothetical protein A2635_01685 [Candidatus Peribacteria bacterium RIFCSPHIGHO2_01_FULL_51_9]
MMNTLGFSEYSSGFFWVHVHWFFGLFALVGFILLTVWALKFLSAQSLKSLASWLLVVGILGSLLTAPLAATGVQWVMGQWKGKAAMHMVQKEMMGQMMQQMTDHDGKTKHADHAPMMDMMQQMMDMQSSGMMR